MLLKRTPCAMCASGTGAGGGRIHGAREGPGRHHPVTMGLRSKEIGSLK